MCWGEGGGQFMKVLWTSFLLPLCIDIVYFLNAYCDLWNKIMFTLKSTSISLSHLNGLILVDLIERRQENIISLLMIVWNV